MKKVLILGASGLVGSAIARELNKHFTVYGTYNSRSINYLEKSKRIKFDLDYVDTINDILNSINPDIIVSALCGDYKKQLLLYNELELYLKLSDKKFILCSSANVYDNALNKIHFESDKVNSKSDYGLFKIRCENFEYKNFCIVRFPFVWGSKSERIKNMISNIKNQIPIDVYDNLFVSNTLDIFIAKEISYIIKNNLNGIYHIATIDIIEHQQFITKLLNGLGYTSYKLNHIIYEKSYLAILSSRKKETNFKIDTNYIINYLIQNKKEILE